MPDIRSSSLPLSSIVSSFQILSPNLQFPGDNVSDSPPTPGSATPTTPTTPPQASRDTFTACVSCHRLKAKCSSARPCSGCQRRGIPCIPNPLKGHACKQCKQRKIRCDRKFPCRECTKHDRECNVENSPGRLLTEKSSVLRAIVPAVNETQPSMPLDMGPVFEASPLTGERNLTEALDLSCFDFDFFSILNNPDPIFFDETPKFVLPENHSLIFDDFDRSRLLLSLKQVPAESKGELPSSSRLTEILLQYFQNIAPLAPIPHIPSFNVRSCPPLFLLHLLGIGDKYSEERTIDQWARKAAQHLLRLEIEKHEQSAEPLPISLIQATSINVLELAYSGDSRRMLQATHYRVTLANACRRLQEEEEENTEIETDDEAGWILWIQRETRRRTLMQVYLNDMSLSMHHDLAPVLRISELNVTLPSSNELWYAESHEKWRTIRLSEKQLQRGRTPLRFSHILSDILHNDGKLLSQRNEIIDLMAASLGVQEIISLTRRLMEVDGRDNVWFSSLMTKLRSALKTWKMSWQEKERSVTRAQFIGLMSSWCTAELYLSAPKFILEMVYKVSTTRDVIRLMRAFLSSVEQTLLHMDIPTFNNLITATTAALLQIETLSEFTSVEDCISTIRAAVYPNVIGSLFLGGICLWFSVRVIRRNGSRFSSIEEGITLRLTNAVAGIRWAGTLVPREKACGASASVTGILGELLLKTRVWGLWRW